ncbi:MAG: UPF0175 family protein [Lewinellaceae bacterium]|nr:UPF0175 family protein [Saprospiraceae bacterium]MCB9339745.1 UPF0175 family protein [Lewinellaceae bacterium]
MQDLIIKGEILEKANISPKELLIDLAVYLYDKGRLSMGQAKKLAGLDQISFQKEMSKRGVYLNYGVEEFKEDLKTLGHVQN